VNELEQEYKDRIDFIKFDLQTNEGYCEYFLGLKQLEDGTSTTKYGFSHLPSMLFYSSSGQLVEKVEEYQDKEQLKAKMDNLLNQPAGATSTHP